MKYADLVVVGGSFAGLACAQAASQRGLDTVVLDRRPAPGHSPNTTGILVKEVADLWDVPRRLTRKIHAVRLYSPRLHHIDLARPGYYFLATDTPGLLQWWARESTAAGVDLRFGSAYRGACIDSAGRVQMADQGLASRYLVGADGVNSSVAEDFHLGRNHRWLAGVEAEYENVGGLDPDMLHVFLDSSLAPGYIAWVVPGFGIAQVGLAAHRGHRIDLDAFIARLGGLFDFSSARRVGCRAGKIPVGGPVWPIGTEKVMLIGDAAGLVSPLTAGGIHTAIDLGRQAGLAVCDHLLDGGPDPRRVIAHQMPRFFFKRMLRTAFDLNPPNFLYDAMLGSPLFAHVARTIFFHHRGLLSARAWHDLLLGWR